MAERSSNVGQRISSLEATVAGMDKYAHEKWHDLNNTLQPLVLLPERITRDIAKLQGSFDGRINAVTKEIERTITVAVENALNPVINDVENLKSRVDALETVRKEHTGMAKAANWLLQSPLIGWLAAAAAIVIAWWRKV